MEIEEQQEESISGRLRVEKTEWLKKEKERRAEEEGKKEKEGNLKTTERVDLASDLMRNRIEN